jgi:hypothetical protein
MSTALPPIQNLTRRLIALEAARDDPSGALAPGAVRVLKKLRAPLSRLAGAAGFRSILSRALALAKAEDASLNPVQVREDGSLGRFAGDWHGPDAGAGEDGGAVVVAHLLGLLVTFIGEPLTLRLVRDAWPDAPVDEMDRRAKGEP